MGEEFKKKHKFWNGKWLKMNLFGEGISLFGVLCAMSKSLKSEHFKNSELKGI